MKNKIISLLVLIALLSPIISSAALVPPFVYITIIVNTEQDASFHYSISGAGQSFNIQTQDLQGSKSTYFYINWGAIYNLSQDIVPGLNIDNILCASTNPATVFSYYPSGVVLTPVGYENIVCAFNNIKAPTKTPVLIVPGLLGTEIYKGDNKLWLDLARNFIDIGDQFMDPLQFNQSLMPIDGLSTGDIIGKETVNVGIGDVTIFDYTDGLINEFATQDYIENETLFTFPYDWRYGVSGVYADGTTNVDLLKQKIDDILQQTGADEVDVVAHSLGGLIIKKYAMDNPTDNHIGKAVFVGVPNTGAPKAVKVLLQGDNFNIPWLADSEVKKIAENMSASYDLLPSQKYYEVKGSFVTTIYVPEPTTENPTAQGVLKDLTYEETKSFLINDHNLNSSGVSNAEILHTQNFDDYDLRTAGIDLYSINGCKTATMSKITEITREGVFGNTIEYRNLKHVLGDGTVPFESATNLPIDQQNKYYALSADHGKMPSQNGIRQQIVNIVSGSNLDTGRDIFGNDLITQDIDKCQLNGKAISVFSPIDIFIIDQSGNKLGLAEDQSIINEVPNADFEIWGEHKFVYLPTDNSQTYTINLQGTDTGTFTIKTDDIQNGQTIQTEVFSNLPVTPELSGQVVFSASAGQPTILLLDTDGNSTTDQSVEPSSVLDATQSDDLLPPLSTLTITAEQGQSGFYRSDVLINIAAEDENSGVLAIEYNLDGAGFQKIAGDTAEFTVSDQGNHTITYFSTDRAGNNEPEKTTTFTIDTTPPEAIIEFNPTIKDIKFTGADATQVTVEDNDDTITLTDQAGNATQITLKDKNRKRKMKADIEEIKYNNIPADITKNKMQFSWNLDKKTQDLKNLRQHIKSKNNYNISAAYNSNTNQTKISGRDETGKIKQVIEGLKLIKVITDKGDLEWGY